MVVVNGQESLISILSSIVGSCLLLTSKFPSVLCLYDTKSGCLTR